MPKYDFRCDDCDHQFELTRSFGQSAAPAHCPLDGAGATRLFSPPLDLLMYRREPVVDTRRPTMLPGALSCHDHGPPSAADEYAEDGGPAGSQWHANGYATTSERTQAADAGGHHHGHGSRHSHDGGLKHSHDNGARPHRH